MTKTKNRSNNFLGPSLIRGYKSQSAISGFFHVALQRGFFTPYDVPAMNLDPQVRYLLWIICAPIHSARWNVICDDWDVAVYIHNTIQKVWINDLNKILRMLSWGSVGGEITWYMRRDNTV